MRDSIKAIVSIAIIIALAVTTFSILNGSGEGTDTVSVGRFDYRITSDYTAEVVAFDYDGYGSGTVKVPSDVMIDGKKHIVTSVGTTFVTGPSVSKVVIPDTVASINAGAFMNCGLKEITIPASVMTIGHMAFNNCASLRSVTFEGAIKSIAHTAFNKSTSLSDIEFLVDCDYSMQDGMMICSSENSLVLVTSSVNGHLDIPEVAWIDDFAFSGSKVTSVTVPTTLRGIGNSGFASSMIENIEVSDDNDLFASIDGVMYSKDLTELVSYPSKKAGTFTIPESVTKIHDYAFYGCTELTGITIGSDVETIGKAVFSIMFKESEESTKGLRYDELPGYSYVLKNGAMIRV